MMKCKFALIALFFVLIGTSTSYSMTLDELSRAPLSEQGDYLFSAFTTPNSTSQKVVEIFLNSAKRDLANSNTRLLTLNYLAQARTISETSSLSFASFNERLSEILIPLLEDSSAEVRIGAIRALSTFAVPGSSLKVADRLFDSNSKVRLVAVENINNFPTADVVTVLTAVLKQENDLLIKSRIVYSIGLIKIYDRDAAATIGALLSTSDAALQEEVFRTLGDIKAKEFTQDIVNTKPISAPNHLLAEAFRIDALINLDYCLPSDYLRKVLESGAVMKTSSALSMVKKCHIVELKSLVLKISQTAKNDIVRDIAKETLASL